MAFISTTEMIQWSSDAVIGIILQPTSHSLFGPRWVTTTGPGGQKPHGIQE